MSSSSSSPSKVSGNLKAAAGTVKENVGHLFGSTQTEAKGAAQRMEGNAEIDAAKSKAYVEGTGSHATGAMKSAAGGLVGNEDLKARGEAEKIKGKTQKAANQ